MGRWHDHMVKSPELLFPGAAALANLGKAIVTSQGVVSSIASTIEGFLHSSSQSVKFLHRAGEFSRYASTANSYVLQAVKPEMMGQAMQDIVSTDIPNAPKATLEHLKILMYSTMNTSSWAGHVVHFNQTTGGDATTTIAYHTMRDDGSADLAVCTNTATFQVLGDL